MKQLDAVLFDLDGTLLDTAPDFFVVVNQLCEQHQYPTLSYESIRNTVSHGARALITLATQLEPQQAGFEEHRQELLNRYAKHLAVKTCLFDGLEPLLNWLETKQIHWGIVTNKPRLYSEAILAQLKLEQRCATLVCPDDVKQTKPDPESLLLACQQINATANNCIYIGDHRRDIEAGQRAGMKTISAGYGYIDANDPATNWGADHHVEQAQELLSLIQNTILS